MIYFLIIFFMILIIYQIYQMYFKYNILEGLANNTTGQYQPYNSSTDTTNVTILAQQNAGNIAFLKDRMDSLQNINQMVQDLSGNVQALQQQVNGLVTTQQQYATQLTGGTAPTITGATSDEPVDTSDLVTE